MHPRAGPEQCFNFRRHGDELAKSLERVAVLSNRRKQGPGFDASGKLAVEPGGRVVGAPANLDANDDGRHAVRSYCESRSRGKAADSPLQKSNMPTFIPTTKITPKIVPMQTAAKILPFMEEILALSARKAHRAEDGFGAVFGY
jgi:hypothetical protein